MSTRHFFDYFFANVQSLDDFETAVDTFRTKAMWLYGNFRHAYRTLATVEVSEFRDLISRTEPRSTAEFDSRPGFSEIEDIPTADLGFLGYISGQKLDDLDVSIKIVQMILDDWDNRREILDRFANKQAKISDVLASRSLAFPPAGLPDDRPSLLEGLEKLVAESTEQRSRQAKAQKIGERNTHRYLTLPYLDVYVATSMRTEDDFISQHQFIRDLFKHDAVRDLKLRYFDPTLSYDFDRIKKGLIECLMLRRARVTIYNAGAEDTMGKDSELAATLAQGKPVIVFVPTASPVTVYECPTCRTPKRVDYDRRAKTFSADHPLGLQISATTGVAHGIIVVRSVEECAKMLRKVILHELSFSIKHEGGNYLLNEEVTGSTLRVVSDDPFLTHAFWAYFRHVKPEPDI